MDSIWKDTPPKVAFDAGTVRTLGCYELLIPLGTGGMAAVWTARKKGIHGFHKIVAVKVLHDRLQDSPRHERMFLDEAKLAARIKHPNVAEIYDLGDQDGALYQVMEWVEGEPLSALLRACRGKIPIPVAVQIGIQVAAGLHAAHQLRDEDGTPLGLVHRDVSPQNILIGFNGTVKVVDFGVAKAASNTDRTAVGQLKGKVAYMSPEQVSGHPVDRRTDIFVLGTVLYLLTTGQHPFRGENEIATIRRLMDGAPPKAPEELDPAYPKALNDLVLQTLSRDPFERCASMADLMRTLETALPPGERLSAEDLGAFMRSRLGKAREHRRLAIKEALQARGEVVSHQGSSPPPASSPSEQPSAPGRVPSSAAMVVSTAAPHLPASGRSNVSMILLACATGVLGGALGFFGSRQVAPLTALPAVAATLIEAPAPPSPRPPPCTTTTAAPSAIGEGSGPGAH